MKSRTPMPVDTFMALNGTARFHAYRLSDDDLPKLIGATRRRPTIEATPPRDYEGRPTIEDAAAIRLSYTAYKNTP